MTTTLSEQDVQEALDTCASEPVHIPGVIQPFGCLIAMPDGSDTVTYASENTAAVLGIPCRDLLGRELGERMPSELTHSLANAAFQANGEIAVATLGEFQVGTHGVTAQASRSHGMTILEFEPQAPSGLDGVDALRTLGFLMHQIEACTAEPDLFAITTRMFRHLSGYDRVMVYRFDSDYNGEVLAEDRNRALPSFQGLRFPHWDIPSQVREIMKRVPLRIISDVDQAPVALQAHKASAQPLDMSLSATRGVSPVHLEYLRNMNIGASMTLTVKLEGRLWGIISFHHRRPRVLAPGLRDIILNVGHLFSSKLLVFRQRSQMDMVARVDGLKDRVLDNLQQMPEPQAATESFRAFADLVSEAMAACGLYMVRDGEERIWGQVPDASVIATLRRAVGAGQDLNAYENLSAAFPNVDNALNGCAGAIVFAPDPDRSAIIFRPEIAQSLEWAGNPDKTIEAHEGRLRLSPRGSFSTYLEQTRGMSQTWSDQDLFFVRRIWSMMETVDRNALKDTLTRQQKRLIGELNHRVRNILAMVRSISQQAQNTSYGSLGSYSRSLEARIEALAASHDIASGSITSVVPIWDLIDREFAPYLGSEANRLIKDGPQQHIPADIAPIISLVVHELVTNAVKYGALSNDAGQVRVRLAPEAGGIMLHWTETGGPPISTPGRPGFGTSLIREAIPFELDGRADLFFEHYGVCAAFFMPDAALRTGAGPRTACPDDDLLEAVDHGEPDRLPASVENRQDAAPVPDGASCLLVEDNYVIAKSLKNQLTALGIGSVEMAATAKTGMETLKIMRPDFVILDINLRGTDTSIPLAQALLSAGVPFFFLSGYGHDADLHADLAGIRKLTKPTSDEDLRQAIAALQLDGTQR